MDQKQSKEQPASTGQDRIETAIEDLPPKKLAVKRDDAVKGGVGYRLLDKFP